MSEKYKQEKVMQIESKITELEKQRAAHVGELEAAQAAAKRAQGEIEADDQHLTRARAELAEAKAA